MKPEKKGFIYKLKKFLGMGYGWLKSINYLLGQKDNYLE